VLNVGAGTGSYEPAATVCAAEPRIVMLRQRPARSAPPVVAKAESLPLQDKSVDVAMALLTVHHWSDVAAGIAQMRRVARERLVFFTWDPEETARFWLLADYLPEAAAVDRAQAVPISTIVGLLDEPEVRPIPIPHDCADGFGAAYWRRPRAYLDGGVRAGMSMLAKADQRLLQPGLDRLAADLGNGSWAERNAGLLELDSLDVGYRLVISPA
jgi:SAM-dependent methyltransferase